MNALTKQVRFKYQSNFGSLAEPRTKVWSFWVAILVACLFFCGNRASAGLVPVVQVVGRVSVSVDAEGNNNSGGGSIRVNKPAGATVRGSFLMAASNFDRTIANGDVTLAGQAVNWTKAVRNNAGSLPTFYHNVFTDVTGIVKPIIDLAPTGLSSLTVTEINTNTIDGTILVVIFDDPNQSTDSSVLLLFGGQNTFGDTFNITLRRPLGSINPNPVATMGLGISFGFQGTNGTGMTSRVDVNGARLTSSAGGGG